MKVSRANQRNISSLCVSMASEGVDALGQANVTPALSAGNKNSPNASNARRHSAKQERGLTSTLPYIIEAEHYKSASNILPLSTKAGIPYDCQTREFWGGKAGEFCCSSMQRDSTGCFYCSKLCQTCDPLVEGRVCSETHILTELESTVEPLQDELQLGMESLSSELHQFVGEKSEENCVDGSNNPLNFNTNQKREKQLSCLSRRLKPSSTGQCLPVPFDCPAVPDADLTGVCGCDLMEVTKSCPNQDMLHSCVQWVKDGYSSLERRCWKHKTKYPCDGSSSFQFRMTHKSATSPQNNEDNSGEEWPEDEFVRNKKERSTLLVRRYYKNNREVKKSVYTGTRAIMRTLPSGHIGDEAWESVCKKRQNIFEKHIRSATENITVLQAGDLRSSGLLHFLARFKDYEEYDASVLMRFLDFAMLLP
ncbi:UNVERIFIED_CONTAM: hypothetical protein FKN15_013838 [Acipenser sinensis]